MFSRNAASLILTARRFVLLPWFGVCFVLLGEAATGSASALFMRLSSLVASHGAPVVVGFQSGTVPAEICRENLGIR